MELNATFTNKRAVWFIFGETLYQVFEDAINHKIPACNLDMRESERLVLIGKMLTIALSEMDLCFLEDYAFWQICLQEKRLPS